MARNDLGGPKWPEMVWETPKLPKMVWEALKCYMQESGGQK